jgi:pimeloyl-ACP methyl ester carboxylesterase
MRVISRGYEVSYSCAGAGEPTFLLLHGMLQAAEDWGRYGYEQELAPCRVIAVDLLGFGGSDKPHEAGAYGLDQLVVDLDTVLDEEGVDRAVVWGYSLGCFPAEAYARQRPDRTRALILGGNLVGLTAVDRGNIVSDTMDLLTRVGVSGYCDENLSFLDDATKQMFVTRNDPVAAGLAAEARAGSHAGDGAPLPALVLNYAGSEEPWYEVAVAVAEVNGVPFRSINGDHGAAFRDSSSVVGLVQDFLTANAASS